MHYRFTWATLVASLAVLSTLITATSADKPVVTDPPASTIAPCAQIDSAERTAPEDEMAAATVPGAPTSGPVPEEELAEIIRIRQLHGDPFAGTVFAEMGVVADRQAFAQALRRVAQRRDAPGAPVRTIHTQQATDADACDVAYRQEIANQQSAAPHDEQLASVLRRTARLLDNKANDLEDALDFDQADRLRNVAHQIRCEARRFTAAPQVTHPSSHSVH